MPTILVNFLIRVVEHGICHTRLLLKSIIQYRFKMHFLMPELHLF